MKLGELMEALESYRANTIGVDEDTKVLIKFDGSEFEVDDAVAILRMTSTGYGGRRNEATVVLEAMEL